MRRDSSTTLFQRNLQNLMTEIFKVKAEIVPELMKGVFGFADVPYSLRNRSKCNSSIPFTERYGIKITASIGPNLWELRVGFPKTVIARYINCSLNM